MKVLLIRHAESEFNRLGKHQGWGYDSELSRKGLTQAKKVAQRLKDENIETVYSSDFKRAWQTAREIARIHKLKVVKDKRLREFRSGGGNKFWAKLNDYKTKEAKRLGIKRYEVKHPSGESEKEHIERVRDFIKDLENKKHKETVVIIAHGQTNKIFFGASRSMEWKDVAEKLGTQENTCINEFKYNPKTKKWKSLKIECTKHLK